MVPLLPIPKPLYRDWFIKIIITALKVLGDAVGISNPYN
jgi:hypothetical protein